MPRLLDLPHELLINILNHLADHNKHHEKNLLAMAATSNLFFHLTLDVELSHWEDRVKLDEGALIWWRARVIQRKKAMRWK
ncbi:hypothetical protein PMZ80_001624 [Knufia obscura]|uniref:F-box domain-containing protein n=2 Tax=Knufia TaxID=430999 RepID=A0AAN8IAG9_9EURO|nr:hypothetical protein PMZ80_001624 [Knufia obscura]KAK5955550.1 hypothetical protein OHC33_003191 [Knufia fluminis]